MEFKERLKQKIIEKLHRQSYWHRRPINFDDLFRSFKYEASRKEVEMVCNELVEEGLLIKKPGIRNCFRYGLNAHRKKEIEKIIGSLLF